MLCACVCVLFVFVRYTEPLGRQITQDARSSESSSQNRLSGVPADINVV